MATLETACRVVAMAFGSLSLNLTTREGRLELLSMLGWMPPPGVDDLDLAAVKLTPVLSALDTLLQSTDQEREDELLILERVGALASAISELAKSVQDAIDAFKDDLPQTYLDTTKIADEFLERFLHFSVVRTLEHETPLIFQLLKLAGVVDITPFDENSTFFQTRHDRLRLRFDRFSSLLSRDSWAREVYGWGTPTADVRRLVVNLGDVFAALGANAFKAPLSRQMEEAVEGRAVPEADTDPETLATVQLVRALWPDTAQGGLAIFSRRPSATGAADAGIGFSPYLVGSTETAFPLFISERRWDLLFVADPGIVAGGLLLGVRAGQDAELKTNFFDAGQRNPPASGRFGVGLRVRGAEDADRIPLFEVGKGTGLDVAEVELVVGGEVRGATGEAFGSLVLRGGRLAVGVGDADGFAAKLLGGKPLELTFELAIDYSQSSGLRIRGSGGFELVLAVNVNLGVVVISAIHARLKADSEALVLESSASVIGHLGPVTATMNRIGLSADVKFESGNLGPADLDLHFKAPSGVGLAVEAGPVAGGGFLLFDEDAQRYSGALALRIYEIEVSAFGIIETRLPDGSEGFSFAILISARFTPIQLGFGFTLNGVGGMLGINRTVETGKLQDAVRSHHLDHVLFPEEPEKNALAVLNDLGAFFPAAEGRYVFGPMAIIGWGGAVPVLEAEIGVILELPEPIRLTLLGQVKLGLPSLQKRFVKLNLDVVGVLDFPKKSFSLDASLYDSDLGGFPVAGDMALRLNWGQQPNFALAIGGFHPLYRAPAGFPPLQRVTVNLGLNGNPRVTLSGYLAVTSNTFQVGAKAELLAYKGSFNLYGWVGFDALFVFKPFSFRADFGAGVSLRKGTSHWATIHVHGTLSGTNPWHVQGNACLSLFFFDICVGFDVDLSKRSPEPIEPLPNILQLLADQLRSLESWNAELPPAAHQLVTLAANQSPDGNPVLDPVGAASVKQRLLPLDQKIDRFEHQKLKKTDPKTFRITKMTLRPDAGAGAKELTKFPAVADHFARGQFQDLSDAAKLSLPAFELMTAGAKLAADEMATGGVIPFKNEYETILIEPDSEVTDTNVYTPAPALVAKFSRRSASALGGLGASGPEKFFAGIGTLAQTSLGAEDFTIATVAGLDARDNLLTTVRERIGFITKGKAREVLEEHLAAHPEQRGQLQVVPAIELPEAA